MSEKDLVEHSKTWDRVGVVVASLCLIHCMALPIIALSLPSLHFFAENIFIEIGVLLLGILVGSLSFITSFRKHRHWGPISLGGLGIALLTWSLLAMTSGGEHRHGHESIAHAPSFEPLVIFGGILLIAGHLWNIRECHCFCEPHCSHAKHQHKTAH